MKTTVMTFTVLLVASLTQGCGESDKSDLTAIAEKVVRAECELESQCSEDFEYASIDACVEAELDFDDMPENLSSSCRSAASDFASCMAAEYKKAAQNDCAEVNERACSSQLDKYFEVCDFLK